MNIALMNNSSRTYQYDVPVRSKVGQLVRGAHAMLLKYAMDLRISNSNQKNVVTVKLI